MWKNVFWRTNALATWATWWRDVILAENVYFLCSIPQLTGLLQFCQGSDCQGGIHIVVPDTFCNAAWETYKHTGWFDDVGEWFSPGLGQFSSGFHYL